MVDSVRPAEPRVLAYTVPLHTRAVTTVRVEITDTGDGLKNLIRALAAARERGKTLDSGEWLVADCTPLCEGVVEPRV